jgi:hypothetical protein
MYKGATLAIIDGSAYTPYLGVYEEQFGIKHSSAAPC